VEIEGSLEAFDNFDVQKVAKYSEAKIEALLHKLAIARNKLKINATVINAQIILEIREEYGSFHTSLMP